MQWIGIQEASARPALSAKKEEQGSERDTCNEREGGIVRERPGVCRLLGRRPSQLPPVPRKRKQKAPAVSAPEKQKERYTSTFRQSHRQTDASMQTILPSSFLRSSFCVWLCVLCGSVGVFSVLYDSLGVLSSRIS